MVSRYRFIKISGKRKRKAKDRFLKSLIHQYVENNIEKKKQKKCECDLKTVLLVTGCQCGGK